MLFYFYVVTVFLILLNLPTTDFWWIILFMANRELDVFLTMANTWQIRVYITTGWYSMKINKYWFIKNSTCLYMNFFIKISI